MCEVSSIKSEQLLPIIQELLKEDKYIILRVTGTSMEPFLRNSKDRVELKLCSIEALKLFDIVLIKRSDGAYILHRVIRLRGGEFFIRGDGQIQWEGPIAKEQLVARVVSVYRGKRRYGVDSLGYRFLALIWYILFPLRSCFIIFKIIICKLVRKLIYLLSGA